MAQNHLLRRPYCQRQLYNYYDLRKARPMVSPDGIKNWKYMGLAYGTSPPLPSRPSTSTWQRYPTFTMSPSSVCTIDYVRAFHGPQIPDEKHGT